MQGRVSWSVWQDSNLRPPSSKPGRLTRLTLHTDNLERGRRIELLALAWKAKVLPLYEPREKLVEDKRIELF